MLVLTRLQREALKRVWLRLNPNTSYLSFRRTVEPGSGCIMVPFGTIWLGIEPDGYTHS